MINIDNEQQLKLKGPCAVKFYLTECAPCKRLDTILTKMEKEFQDCKFYSVNIDDCIPLAKKYEIKSAPTLLFFKEGDVINKIVGLMGTEVYRTEFKKLIEK